MRVTTLTLILSLFAAQLVAAQQPARPVPYPIPDSPGWKQAVENGTRTNDGHPGPNYWSNRAHYTIKAELEPETAMVSGRVTIRYTNDSPDSIRRLRIHLRQNLHREGAMRTRRVEVTGGMTVGGLTVNGEARTSSRMGLRGTVSSIRLRPALASGESVEIGLDFSFRVPRAGQAPRMGHEANHVFYLGYWYPQVAVVDDVRGWVAGEYLGRGEFYMGYADYDVEFTAPTGWLVHATGALTNAEEVLTEQSRERLQRAMEGRDVVQVFEDPADSAPGRGTLDHESGKLTWKFHAENVRDVAVSLSDRYQWDATHAVVQDAEGERKVLIQAVYESNARHWDGTARYARHTIEFNSTFLYPYPWPHMTVCEGIIGGGMEFPMMTIIGSSSSERRVHGVTAHELIHMWFPMIVGSDEKNFSWMDEGMTTGTQAFTDHDFWRQEKVADGFNGYVGGARRGRETEIMRPSDFFPGQSPYGFASYTKTAAIMHQLRYLIGDEAYLKGLREYVADWAFKHPYPRDLFSSFARAAGRDLDWYFRTWFFETWTLDHSVGSVEAAGDGAVVTIKDLGYAPHPATVEVTFGDERVETHTVPVDHWLAGHTSFELKLEEMPTRVKIDPLRHTVDIDRTNNNWAP